MKKQTELLSDRVTIWSSHAAYPMVAYIARLEADVIAWKARAERWRQAFDEVALKKKKRKK